MSAVYQSRQVFANSFSLNVWEIKWHYSQTGMTTNVGMLPLSSGMQRNPRYVFYLKHYISSNEMVQNFELQY